MKKNFKTIRRQKYYLYKYGIPKILPSKSLKFLGHLSELTKWIDEHRDIKFTDFPIKKFDYRRRFDLHQFIVESELNGGPIDYLEFGVAKGNSFRWWVDHIKNDNSRFYGFDTFTGLPEDWGPFKAGDMSNGNNPPEINDHRVQFFQGIFQKTLFQFLKSYQSDRKKVIHLDSDLYSSTLFVLTSLSPYLNSGDIILFDEFNVPMHEFKAFDEWVKSFYIDYEVLGEVNNYYQVAVKIK